MLRDPDLLQRQVGERDHAEGDDHRPGASRLREQAAPALGDGQRTLEALQPLRAHARLQVGRDEAGVDAERLGGAHGLWHRDCVRVGIHHLERDTLPGEALDGRGRGVGEHTAPLGLVVELAQRLRERLGVTGRD